FSCLELVSQICRHHKGIIRRVLYHGTEPFPTNARLHIKLIKELHSHIGTRDAHLCRLLQDPADLLFHSSQFPMLKNVSETFIRQPYRTPKTIANDFHGSYSDMK